MKSMKVILMVALLALSGATFAKDNNVGHDNGNGSPPSQSNNGNGGNGGSGGDALALQGQAQGQLQGQAQSATSVALAGAAAGAAVLGSGNSRNDNELTNLSLQGTNVETGDVKTGDVVSDVKTDVKTGDIQNNTTVTTGEVKTATSQEQTSTANNEGVAQDVVVNNNESKNLKRVEVVSVPTAIAPNVYPTASCAMSASVGASALGWGVSGGGTKVNEECMMLEGARMFAQLGYPVQGIILACSTKSAIAVFGSAQKCVDAGTPSQPVSTR
jgi:hypothetical protein